MNTSILQSSTFVYSTDFKKISNQALTTFYWPKAIHIIIMKVINSPTP